MSLNDCFYLNDSKPDYNSFNSQTAQKVVLCCDDVTGAVINTHADDTALIALKKYCFMRMLVCSLYFDSFRKVGFKEIAIYCLTYSITTGKNEQSNISERPFLVSGMYQVSLLNIRVLMIP